MNNVEALQNYMKVNVIQALSDATKKNMIDHRTALRKIFSTLKVFRQQGLPLRGHRNDESSNFLRFLKARAEDVQELEKWLARSGHK